jgi:hypothetical protein
MRHFACNINSDNDDKESMIHEVVGWVVRFGFLHPRKFDLQLLRSRRIAVLERRMSGIAT